MGTFQEASPWEPRSQVSGVSRAHNTQHNTTRNGADGNILSDKLLRESLGETKTQNGVTRFTTELQQRETCTSSQPPALHLSVRKEPVGNFGCSPGRSSLQQPHTSGRMEITKDKYFYLSEGVELVVLLLQEVFVPLLKYRM